MDSSKDKTSTQLTKVMASSLRDDVIESCDMDSEIHSSPPEAPSESAISSESEICVDGDPHAVMSVVSCDRNGVSLENGNQTIHHSDQTSLPNSKSNMKPKTTVVLSEDSSPANQVLSISQELSLSTNVELTESPDMDSSPLQFTPDTDAQIFHHETENVQVRHLSSDDIATSLSRTLSGQSTLGLGQSSLGLGQSTLGQLVSDGQVVMAGQRYVLVPRLAVSNAAVVLSASSPGGVRVSSSTSGPAQGRVDLIPGQRAYSLLEDVSSKTSGIQKSGMYGVTGSKGNAKNITVFILPHVAASFVQAGSRGEGKTRGSTKGLRTNEENGLTMLEEKVGKTSRLQSVISSSESNPMNGITNKKYLQSTAKQSLSLVVNPSQTLTQSSVSHAEASQVRRLVSSSQSVVSERREPTLRQAPRLSSGSKSSVSFKSALQGKSHTAMAQIGHLGSLSLYTNPSSLSGHLATQEKKDITSHDGKSDCGSSARTVARQKDQKRGGSDPNAAILAKDIAGQQKQDLRLTRRDNLFHCLHPLIDHDYCEFAAFSADIQSSIISTTDCGSRTERRYAKKSQGRLRGLSGRTSKAPAASLS